MTNAEKNVINPPSAIARPQPLTAQDLAEANAVQAATSKPPAAAGRHMLATGGGRRLSQTLPAAVDLRSYTAPVSDQVRPLPQPGCAGPCMRPSVPEATLHSASSLPPHASLGLLPASQGGCGSCYVFSAVEGAVAYAYNRSAATYSKVRRARIAAPPRATFPESNAIACVSSAANVLGVPLHERISRLQRRCARFPPTPLCVVLPSRFSFHSPRHSLSRPVLRR